MDKKIKLLRYFLNYLSKKFKFQEISFEDFNEITTLLGYKDYVNNKNLFDFYNENVIEDINWNDIDSDILKQFIYTFKEKIQIIENNGGKYDGIFQDEDLRPKIKGTTLDIKFGFDIIDFYFDYYDSKILQNLLNVDEDSLNTYGHAEQGNAYRPEYESDDLLYIFKNLNDENDEIIKKLLSYAGKFNLSKIDYRVNEEVISEVIKVLQKAYGDKFLDNMFDEYAYEVESASANSVKETFNEHFPDGVRFVNGRNFEVTYSYFLDFLDKNPDINSFYDLKNHTLIEYELYDLYEASYNYDFSWDDIDEKINSILSNLLDKVEDDEDLEKKLDGIKEFENIIKSLKFESGDNRYYRDFKIDKKTFKRIQIYYDKIDFVNKKVILEEIVSEVNKVDLTKKTYKIPFDEIADYVMTEKLYESLKIKINKYLSKN